MWADSLRSDFSPHICAPYLKVSCLKEYQVMESLFKSIAIGVFVGLAGTLFLYVFSEYISEQSEALVFGVFAGAAFLFIDLIAKKIKSNSREGS
jgi:hypothetical protein